MEKLELNLTKAQNRSIEELVKQNFGGDEKIKYRLIYKNPSVVEEVVGMEVYPFSKNGVSLTKPIKVEVENWEEDGVKGYFLHAKDLGIIAAGGKTFDEAVEDFREDLVHQFVFYLESNLKDLDNYAKEDFKVMRKFLTYEPN
ncbi:hypothetical protein IT568_00130 [bacterium]|nr:hypothetical protein [bacterium]